MKIAVSRKKLTTVAGAVLLLALAAIVGFKLLPAGAEAQVNSEEAAEIKGVAREVAPLSASGHLNYEPEKYSKYLAEGFVKGLQFQFTGVSKEQVENAPLKRKVAGEPEIVKHEIPDEGKEWVKLEIPVEVVDKETGEVQDEQKMWLFVKNTDEGWKTYAISYSEALKQ